MGVSSSTNAAGTAVTVDVTVQNFTTIFGYQGGISFDADVLEYVSHTSPQANVVNIVGAPGSNAAIPADKLTYTWFDFSGSGVTLTDNSVVLQITFNVKPNVLTGTTGAVTIDGSLTPVGYTDPTTGGMVSSNLPVTPGEVLVNPGLPIPPPTVSDINVCEGDDTEIAPTGSMGITLFNFYPSDPTIGSPTPLASGVSAYDPGTTAGTSPQTIWVTSANNAFESTPVSVTVTVSASPTPPTITGSSQIGIGQTTTLDAGAGFASYLWSPGGENTQTISAGDGTYTVTVTNANGCPATSAPFTVTESALTLEMAVSSATGLPGTDVTLDVTVKNFNTITNYQGTVTFDATLLDFVGFSSPLAPTIINVVNTPGGGLPPLPADKLTFLWTDAFGTGQILNDDDVILTLTFHIKASAPSGSVANIGIDGSQTPLGYSDANLNFLPYNVTDGTITVGTCDKTGTDNVTICSDATPYIFGTQSLNTTGVYTEIFSAVNGCDSTVTLTLTVNPTYDIILSPVVCSDQFPITFGSQTVTLPPFGPGPGFEVSAYEVFQSVDGCDSAVLFAPIIIYPRPLNAQTPTICGNEASSVNLTAFESAIIGPVLLPGTEVLSYSRSATPNVLIADPTDVSVIDGEIIIVNWSNGLCNPQTTTITFTVNPTYDLTDAISLCNSALPYTFGTQSLIGPGTYTETFQSQNGCDSTVTLTLSVDPIIQTTDAVTICEDATPYIFGTQSLNVSGVFMETFTSSVGCDSVVTLTLVVDQLPVLTALTPTICASDASSVDLTIYQSQITTDPGSFSWARPGATISELFISEYVEGSGNNKYLEIYNGTGATVDLSDYELRLYINGASSPNNTNALSGSLADGDVIVYANSGATIYTGATTTASTVNFNGDDVIALYNNATGTFADILGHIGQDPGSEWSQGSNGTQDETLVRNPSVTQGVTSSSFDFPELGTEWTSFAQNTISDLGSHTVNVAGSVAIADPTDVAIVDGDVIIVTVTEGACVVSTTLTFTVSPAPMPMITGPLAYCEGTAGVTLDAGTYASYLWSNGETTQTISALAGIYSVTVTDANGCVGTSASVTVVENANPTPVISGSLEYCEGTGGVTLDAGTYASYLWSPNGETTQTITALAGTYSVMVTDGNGCMGTSPNVTVTEDALPVLTALTPTVCEADAASVDLTTYQSQITTDPGTFSWSKVGSGPSIADLFISEYVEGSSNNKYIEIYNGTGADVDLSDYELHLFVNGAFLPQIDALSGTIPDGGVVVLANSSASAYSGATVNSSSVNFNGDDGIGLFNEVIGNYADFIGHIGEDPGAQWSQGGNGTVNQTLVRNPSVTAGVVTSTSGFPQLSTEWTSFSVDNVSNLGSHTVNAGGLMVITDPTDVAIANGDVITVTVTNGLCEVSTTLTFTVIPTPTPIISGLLAYCEGTGGVTLDAGTYASYLWSTGETAQTITALAGTYSVTVTDANGCVGTSASVTVIENANPTPIISGLLEYCEGTGGVTLDAGTYTSYLWSNGETTQTITALAGTYSVTVTDANGCVGTSASVTVIENANPTPTISGPVTVCPGSMVTLDAGTYASYQWSTSETTQTIMVGAGTYTVTVTDANGCVGTSASFTVVENSVITPVISGPLAYCEGTGGVTLDAGTYASYLW
ncbi:MAG: lamin tail domain-containing protein, partial [Bacteroidota bacterium]